MSIVRTVINQSGGARALDNPVLDALGAVAQQGARIGGALLLGWLRRLAPTMETTWSLVVDDPLLTAETGPPLLLAGDTIPDAFRHSSSLQIGVSAGFQTMRPITRPNRRDPAPFEVEQTYWSEDHGHDLSPIIFIAKRLQEPWAELRNSPPMCRFEYGIFNERVWVQSASTELPHGYWPGTERPIMVKLRLTLLEANTHTLRERSIFPKETSWHVLGHGETFEDLALARYGDPNLAPLIRRTNPEILEEYPGARVKLLDLDHPDMQQSTGPTCPALLENFEETMAEVAAAHAARAPASWDAIASLGEMTEATRGLYDAGA